MLGLLAGGCVLPPPLDVEGTDGGTDSPPVIVAATPSDLAFPGPIVVSSRDILRQVTLVVSDNDIDDTLYLRFFRDWSDDNPLPPFSFGSLPASGLVGRTGNFFVANWCIDVEDTDAHILEAMVADREFLETGSPPFRALPAGARSSIRAWLLTCQPDQ